MALVTGDVLGEYVKPVLSGIGTVVLVLRILLVYGQDVTGCAARGG